MGIRGRSVYGIYFSSNPLRKQNPRKAVELSGVVRLADKYVGDELRAQLIQHVTEGWPTTLHEWDVREGEASAITTSLARTNRLSRRRSIGPYLADVVPEPASAIMFAQEFGCHEILPAAYYQLARISVKADLDNRNANHSQRLARWSALDNSSLLRHLHGREALEEYSESFARLDYGVVRASPR